MAAQVKIQVNSRIDIATEREDTFSSRTPAELLAEAVEESGEDQNDTIRLVTPTKDYVYLIPSKFIKPVKETNINASAESVY